MDRENKSQNKIVQTFTQDMASVIENDKSGLIKKIIRGEEEHELEKIQTSPESKRNRFFVILSLLCIVLGSVILIFFFFQKQASVVPIETQFAPLIFSDASASIDAASLSKDNIIQAVSNAVKGTKVKTGGVEGIYLLSNKQQVGLRSFITLTKSSFAPNINPTTAVSDNFLMGMVNTGDTSGLAGASGGKDFFILLKMHLIVDIFNSMRAWENKMFSELHGFFGIDMTADTSYLSTANFENGVIGNKNARILYNKDRKIVLMYIFADDNSVVITSSESAAREIMLRLASSQLKK